MKLVKHSKWLFLSCSLLGIFWYFYPCILFVWLWHFNYNDEFRSYVNCVPEEQYVNTVFRNPDTYEKFYDVKINLFEFGADQIERSEKIIQLKMPKGKAIIFHSPYLLQGSQKTIAGQSINYFDLQDRLNIINQTSGDISIFNNRNRNVEILQNIILKSIGITKGGYSKILLVKNDYFDTICKISIKSDNGYMCFVYIFQDDIELPVSVVMKDYENVNEVENDLIKLIRLFKA
ncbi:hypothetical protein [Desulfosediminicola ganghwensis]|uniref:hypothetical protein n=1 Tax=Desulfosediminicola ganghwensis TaxID=2569540 RepID=UPI0010AB8A60|nr:hypothetical protein [Desulfosediminicola ganghwensis]